MLLFVSTILGLFLGLWALVYIYLIHKYRYWAKQDVPGPRPSLFTFGNTLQIYRHDPTFIEPALVKQYGLIYGTFTGLEPTLNIANPELIKTILVKDFVHFFDKRQLPVEHYMVENNPFFANGNWKRLRSAATPAFSSGKLKAISGAMDAAVDRMVEHLGRLAIQNGGGRIFPREAMISFSMDTITRTGFSTEVLAGDRSMENPVLSNATSLFDSPPTILLCYFALPKWFNRLVGVEGLFNPSSFKFIEKMLIEMVGRRKCLAAKSKTKTKPTDILDVLREGNTLSEPELLGIASGFLFGGFETIATTLTCALYELAINADVQERLHSELCEALGSLPGPAPSEEYFEKVFNGIDYLDAFCNEVLRKYPAAQRLERRLVVDGYQLGELKLPKGQLIEIPVYAVHHNPEYYPDPECFNPDRFLPENAANLIPYTFLPFGAGPRNCIGNRFAYREMKLGLAKAVQAFRFVATEKTPKRLEFASFNFSLLPKPFYIKVERRL